MSKLRPDERPTQTDLPALHRCKGRELAERLLAYERGLPLGQGETLVPRKVWLEMLKLAAEALEET